MKFYHSFFFYKPLYSIKFINIIIKKQYIVGYLFIKLLYIVFSVNLLQFLFKLLFILVYIDFQIF